MGAKLKQTRFASGEHAKVALRHGYKANRKAENSFRHLGACSCLKLTLKFRDELGKFISEIAENHGDALLNLS